MSNGFRIKSISAFISVDPNDGDEGIIGTRAPDGSMMPMIAADEDRLNSLRPIAEQMAAHLPHEVKLVRFTNREDVEVIE